MNAAATAGAKDQAQRTIADAGERLIDLSRRIHDHPELAFEEERAAAWCAEALDAAGFAVETGVCGLPTALRPVPGTGPSSSPSAPSTTPFQLSAMPAVTT